MSEKYKKPSPSENEKEVMDYFERMFAFEFYVRYLKLNHSHDLRRVQRLNKIVTKRFIDFSQTHDISDIGEILRLLPDGMNNQCPDTVDIHYFIRWSLDKLQGLQITTASLNQKLNMSGLFFPKDVLKFIETQIMPLVKYVKPRQKLLAFSFYDLTHPNDLYSVFYWWCKHIDIEPGKEKKKVPDMSMKVERLIKNDHGSSRCTAVKTLTDFYSPAVILNKEDRYSVYSTNTHSIKINDRELSNSTVLVVDFYKNTHLVPEALEDFEKLLLFNHERQHSGNNNTYPAIMRTIDSSQYAKVIERYDYISRYLLGLLYFDELKKSNIKNESPNKNAFNEDSRTVANKIENNTKLHFELSEIDAGYDEVSRLISIIPEIIELKQKRQRYRKKYGTKEGFAKK